MKFEIVDKFEIESVDDNEQARIANLCGQDESSCLFVRVQSWDETRKHEEFRSLEGKKVRVTIEVIEENEKA